MANRIGVGIENLVNRVVDPHGSLAKTERRLVMVALLLIAASVTCLIISTPGGLLPGRTYTFLLVGVCCAMVAGAIVLHCNQRVSGNSHYWGHPTATEWMCAFGLFVAAQVLADRLVSHKIVLNLLLALCILYSVAAEALSVSSIAQTTRKRWTEGLPLVDRAAAPLPRYKPAARFVRLFDPYVSMPSDLRAWFMLYAFSGTVLGLSEMPLAAGGGSFPLLTFWMFGAQMGWTLSLNRAFGNRSRWSRGQNTRLFLGFALVFAAVIVIVGYATRSFEWTVCASMLTLALEFAYVSRIFSKRLSEGDFADPPVVIPPVVTA